MEKTIFSDEQLNELARQVIELAGFRKFSEFTAKRIEWELIPTSETEHEVWFKLRNGRFHYSKDNKKMHYCAGQDYVNEMKRFREYIRN